MNICTAALILILSFWSSAPVFEQQGKASFYADRLRGRPTASGERYNPKALTGAHVNLPFNTYVTVTNLRNSRSVTIRINDRLPGRSPKVLDLSKAAAQRLGMVAEGIGHVRLAVMKLPKGAELPAAEPALAEEAPVVSG